MAVPVGPGAEMLLGRAIDLEAIDQALASAAAGRGALLLVAGEPGIGKTRLADAFEDRARTCGFSVHWGRAWETGGAPPYWPWAQILGSIAAEPGLAAAGVPAALEPILSAEKVGQVVDAGQARFRLFEGAASLLRVAGGKTPRALILDDVHAADPSSLELLRFVARTLRGMPVALLATYRDVEARLQPGTRDALSRIARDGTVLPDEAAGRVGVLQSGEQLPRGEYVGAGEQGGLDLGGDVHGRLVFGSLGSCPSPRRRDDAWNIVTRPAGARRRSGVRLEPCDQVQALFLRHRFVDDRVQELLFLGVVAREHRQELLAGQEERLR